MRDWKEELRLAMCDYSDRVAVIFEEAIACGKTDAVELLKVYNAFWPVACPTQRLDRAIADAVALGSQK